QQRQFGEQDRAVHVEPQPIRPHGGTHLAFRSRRAAGGHIRGTWPRAASTMVLVSWSVSGHSPTCVPAGPCPDSELERIRLRVHDESPSMTPYGGATGCTLPRLITASARSWPYSRLARSR